MAKKDKRDKNLSQIVGPKYWFTWFAMGIAYLLSFLPWRVQQKMGGIIGLVIYKLAPKRRHICDINLKICYPDMSNEQRKALIKEHFISTGKGLFETFTAWFQPTSKLSSRAVFNSQDVIDKVLAKGRGCVLISGHFSSLDICGSFVAQHVDVHPIYKRQNNPVFNWIMEQQRKKVFTKTIERSDMREVLKSLKQNKTVWYAIDQDYGRRYSVFAPFFGKQCATISHIGRVAKMTNAPVIFYDYGRTSNGYEYRFTEIEGYPADDDVENATRINKLMEQVIEPKKEQYLWSHRRFKTQPNEGDPSPYDT